MHFDIARAMREDAAGTLDVAGNHRGPRIVRDAVRIALTNIAGRFSTDAPLFDSRALRARYGSLDAWPVDAELGLSVLAWTLGPGFNIKGFRGFLSGFLPDFEKAADCIPVGKDATQIVLNGIAGGCLRNGSVIVRFDLDPEILYWPHRLSSCIGAAPP